MMERPHDKSYKDLAPIIARMAHASKGVRRMGPRLLSCGLQSGAAGQTRSEAEMSGPANCKLAGRWRTAKTDIWDRDHLDLCGLAIITITDPGRGEAAFGAL
jgi:hypothetical protein